MRSAIKEDEWFLRAAIILRGGLLHLAIFVRENLVNDDIDWSASTNGSRRQARNPSRSPALWDEAAEALPGMVRITARAWTGPHGRWALESGRASCWLARSPTPP